MTVTLFLASAALEIAGVGLVVLDVRRDRKKASDYLDRPQRVQSPQRRFPSPTQAIEDEEIRSGSDYGQMLHRQRLERDQDDMQSIATGAAEAELEFKQTIADILRGNLTRRLAGPLLVALGIAVGTWANIRAL